MYRRRKGPNVILLGTLAAVALIASLVSGNSKPAPAPVENVAQSETATLRPEDIPLPKVDSVQRSESASTPANSVEDIPLPKVDSVQRSETASAPANGVEDIPLPKVDSVPRSETASPPPSEPEPAAPEPATTSYSYVLNTNTKRIHKPGCSSVYEMNPKNRQRTNKSIEELEAEGYQKCKRCF
ncbi:MAG: hypothetical protein IKR84_00375 [Oscillibacter sp.]|nr:hypothetical protein [Oscillibacter sp.]